MLVANKYRIIDKINEGNFGVVFKALNIRTNEYVAIKIEYNNIISSTNNEDILTEHKNNNNDNNDNNYNNKKINTLKHEANIYYYLNKYDGFPQLKNYGTTNDYNFLVMNLLDYSLYNIIENNIQLTNKQIMKIGIQIFNRIKILHENYLIHRDIKPSNFMIKDTKLYLIDFGFSKVYCSNNIHIEYRELTNIIGSLNFVSLNIHNRIEPTRRDDLESCVYVLYYLIKKRLLWENLNNEEEIIIMKSELIYNDNTPNFIKNLLVYIRSLGFEEEPNYEYILNILNNVLNNIIKN
jgi:serine/threonine protein kinase